MNFPFYTNKPIEKPSQPVELPKSRQSSQIDPKHYLADAGLVDAVNVALLLGQPLLLTGEPGTGKTQLAYSLAHQLGLGKPHKFETKSTSTSRDLFYFYDALGHFSAIQLKQEQINPADYLTFNALGQAIVSASKRSLSLSKGAIDVNSEQEAHRSVVLIDEIDKAPRDFPNDILNEMENLYFRIPELSNLTIKINPELRPILVLTSNSEKSLPDAFLRRCIYYHIPFPTKQQLEEIIEVRLGQFTQYSSAFLADALELFLLLRDSGLRKKPATAELLNWLSILRELFKTEKNPLVEQPNSILRTLSSLVKTQEDQAIAKSLVEKWLAKKNRK